MTAQSVYLLIRKAVRDPNGAASVPITASNCHTLDGETWSVQQMLDIYNISRRAMIRGMRDGIQSNEKLMDKLKNFELNANITWSASASTATGQKPDGHMFLVDDETSILTTTGVPLRLRQKPGKLRAGNNPELTQSSTDIYIYETGDTYKQYGGQIINAQVTSIHYVGITDFIIADITTATPMVNDLFQEDDYPLLIEVATLVANGTPIQDINNYVAGKVRG